MDHFYVSTLSFSILLISIIILYIKSFKRKAYPLPPGPRGVPILGYFPFLSSDLVTQFTNLSHKYGPIFKLWLGSKLCIVISSPSLVKEVVRDKDSIFSYRDVPIAAFVGTYGANDLAWHKPDSSWRLMRKVFVHEMQSSNNLEATYNLRKEEVRKTIKNVYSMIGNAIDIGKLAQQTELNVVMNMLWGGTIQGDESERVGEEFRALILEFVDLFGTPNISDFYPILARFDLQGIKRKMEGHVKSLDNCFDSIIAEHNKKLLAGEIKKGEKKDFLQILLELKENDVSEMSITQTKLNAILMDVVVGGTDTVATSVEWVIAELMNNPRIMKKAQNELFEVVGLNNIIEELHLPKLKYMEAIIKETLRLHPPIPLLLPRSPCQSSTIGGYTVPTNTRVFINISAIQRDPSNWDKPLEFEPERFLEDMGKGDFTGNNFEYLPFGSGRRVCPGMPLGERMLIYLVASLMHSFDWKLPGGETLDMSHKFAIVLRKNIPLLAIPSPRLSNLALYA